MRLCTAKLAKGNEWRSTTMDLSLSGTVQMLPADEQTLMLGIRGNV